MPLDVRGQIAAAEIAFYVPIAVLTSILTIRYALRRDAGWIFLCLFSLARIASGALIVAAELKPNNIDLFIAAYTLFPAALGLLMISTLGFVGLAGQHSYSEELRTTHILRFFGFIAMIAMGLSVAGSLLGTHVNPNASAGLTLRRVAAGVYAALYVLYMIMHIYCLMRRYFIKHFRRQLLYGVCFGLLSLGVRVAYAVLAAWSSSDLFGQQPSSNPTLAKFNPITGDWTLYLVLGLIMEYCTVGIYLFSSTILLQRHRHY